MEGVPTQMIFVRTLTETFTLDVSPYDTIGIVKERIEVKRGIDPAQQILIFATNTLDDTQTVAHYNIIAGSSIHLRITAVSMPSGYRSSYSSGMYGSYVIEGMFEPIATYVPQSSDYVVAEHKEHKEYAAMWHDAKKYSSQLKNVDLDSDLVLNLTHLDKLQELFHVDFNQNWNVFVTNTISPHLIESNTKFNFYVNNTNENAKISYNYNGKLSTKVKKGDIIIVSLNQIITNFAPIPAKPANVDDIAPPIVHCISFDNDEKIDFNKYKASMNSVVMNKVSNVTNDDMKLSKLKNIVTEATNNNEANYKLTFNLDHQKEFVDTNAFCDKVKRELAATLNVDVNSIRINQIMAGSIIIRITIDEKGTTRLVQNHVLKQKEFDYWSINRCIKNKNMDTYYRNKNKHFNESTAMWTLLKAKYSTYKYQQMRQASKSKNNSMASDPKTSQLIEPLSFDQIAAIFLYTTNYIYKDLRADLSAMKATFADFIVELIVGINKLPMVWHKTYRGFSGGYLKRDPHFFKDYKKGNILRWDSMNSASLNQDVAKNWAGSGYAVEIEAYHGRDIMPFSMVPGEAEVIYIISSHFLITGQYAYGGRTWFKAKEMAFPWNDKAVLWVDDKPEGNKSLMERLEREGKMVIPRVSTKQAMDFLKFMKAFFLDNNQFHKYRIVSDMKRFEKANEEDENSKIITDKKAGATLVQQLRKQGYQNEVCIFTGYAPHAIKCCDELGCTQNIIATADSEECFQFCLGNAIHPLESILDYDACIKVIEIDLEEMKDRFINQWAEKLTENQWAETFM